MSQTEYLNTSAMRATSCSMSLASSVLGFDIVEIWSELEDGKLRCTFVHADDRMKERYPAIITGHYPLHKREHKLSPRLCEMARKSPKRYHWRVLDLSSPNHKIPADMVSIYENLAFPLKTEMAYQLQIDPEYGYASGACFIVAFSVQVVQFRPSKLKFLSGISVAIFVAAFDLDEDMEETERTIALDEELDAKEFKGQHHTHTNDLLESKENLASVEHALACLTIPPQATATAASNVQEPSKDPLPGRPANADDEEGDEDEDEEEEMDTKKAVVSAKATIQRAPIISKYAGKAAALAALSKSMSRNAVVPTWEPAASYSYPISKVPVKYAIYDNLTFNSFRDVKHIADGSNANIFTGLLNGERVIIKMIKEFMEKDNIAVNEFNVEYGTLARLDHKHIIRVLGAGKIPRRFIVLEYLGGGSLHDLLMKNQQVAGSKLQKLFHKPTFTYASLLTAAKAIAEAMHYLHVECHAGATIIHRDLKPDNIGFTRDGKVKLFDFGLCTCVKARSHPYDSYQMTGYTGSLRYMAPEVYQRKPYCEKADVYSFGIMLWQMARDKVPFRGYEKDEFVRQVMENNERPKLDKSWPAGLCNLLRACWDADPVQRPSFAKIIADINKLMNSSASTEATEGDGSASAISEKEMRKGRLINTSEKSIATSSWF